MKTKKISEMRSSHEPVNRNSMSLEWFSISDFKDFTLYLSVFNMFKIGKVKEIKGKYKLFQNKLKEK
jgi:hypothetical protein